MWKTIAAMSISLSLLILFFPCNEGRTEDSREPVAKVAGRTITAEEIQKALGPKIYLLEKQIYQLKKEKLQQMIGTILLEQEAAGRKVSSQELIDKTLSQGVAVSQEEIDTALRENRDRLPTGMPEAELRSKMADYLANQKAYKRISEFTNELGAKFGVEILLKEPSLPEVAFSESGVGKVGPATAPVTVIELSDYQCSACKKQQQTSRLLQEKYAAKVRWLFKPLPQGIDSPSAKFAEAALCAEEQGRFSEFNDLLFSGNSDLNSGQIPAFGEAAKLDMGKFNKCLSERVYRKDVEKNIEEGRGAGISVTPCFVVNGKLVQGGPTMEEFSVMIDQALKEAASQKGSKVANSSSRK